METHIGVKVQQLRDLAISIQNDCIGFCIRNKETVEWVLTETEYTFTTVTVTSSFGIHTAVRPKSMFDFVRFPDNKSLSDMLSNPFEYVMWYNTNIKQQ